MRYKIVKIDAKQRDFIEKYKVSACTYCDYSEGYFCTFRGRRCPAGKEEYLTKIYLPRKIKFLKLKL